MVISNMGIGPLLLLLIGLVLLLRFPLFQLFSPQLLLCHVVPLLAHCPLLVICYFLELRVVLLFFGVGSFLLPFFFGCLALLVDLLLGLNPFLLVRIPSMTVGKVSKRSKKDLRSSR